LKELNFFLLEQERLLKKEILTDNETEILKVLNDFIDNLPISLDTEVNAVYSKLKEFAKKIGKRE
jgi:hypothetical protein